MEWLLPFLVGGLVVGFAVGRWWVFVGVVLIPIGYIPFGEDSDGAQEWIWALVLIVPPTLVALAVGVVLRKLAARRVERP